MTAAIARLTLRHGRWINPVASTFESGCTGCWFEVVWVLEDERAYGRGNIRTIFLKTALPKFSGPLVSFSALTQPLVSLLKECFQVYLVSRSGPYGSTGPVRAPFHRRIMTQSLR